jgi:carboxylesterase type B
MQSGAYSSIVESTETSRPIVDYLSNITGCNNTDMLISCLRNLTADDLMAASLQTNTVFNSPLSTIWKPVIDGDIVQRQQLESVERGLFRKIPIMINTNQDEATFFITELIVKPSDINVIKFKTFPFINLFEKV